MENTSNNHENGNSVNTMLAPVFIAPFRVGKKQMRAVLDATGKEVVIFPKGLVSFATEYCEHLNRIYPNGC